MCSKAWMPTIILCHYARRWDNCCIASVKNAITTGLFGMIQVSYMKEQHNILEPTHVNTCPRCLRFLQDRRCSCTPCHWRLALPEWRQCSSCSQYTGCLGNHPNPTRNGHLSGRAIKLVWVATVFRIHWHLRSSLTKHGSERQRYSSWDWRCTCFTKRKHKKGDINRLFA